MSDTITTENGREKSEPSVTGQSNEVSDTTMANINIIRNMDESLYKCTKVIATSGATLDNLISTLK